MWRTRENTYMFLCSKGKKIKIPKLSLFSLSRLGGRLNGSGIVHLQLRRERHYGPGRVHRVHGQLPVDSSSVSPEASFLQQQQVHLQLRSPHLQLPRRRRLRFHSFSLSLAFDGSNLAQD